MQKLGNPFPLFVDLTNGEFISGGSIYVGVANGDPYNVPADRISVYKDSLLTQELPQPIRTISGFAVDGTTPILMFIAEADYSMNVRDSLGAQIEYSPETFNDASAYQPASAVLDALVMNGSPTMFGLSLLLLANSAGLAALLPTLAYLSTSGGTINGETLHTSSGAEFFWDNTLMASGRSFLRAAADADPTTLPGHVLMRTA